MSVFVADTDEKAQELGKGFMFGGGPGAFSRPEHTLPPGYNSRDAIRRLARMPSGSWVGVSSERLKQAQEGKSANAGKDYAEVRRKLMAAYDKAQKDYLMIVGSPKTVIEKVKTILRLLRVSILTVFQVQGTVNNEERQNSMRLFAQEVMPAVREYAKELNLTDPFERFPGSVRLPAGVARLPVVDRTPLASLKPGA
jgi:alkanesulfonate monooxygenase SsuD/methylene tetrahydromethanopterin reductase-like flavin-dependent oxidoreductase (luciferase family)